MMKSTSCKMVMIFSLLTLFVIGKGFAVEWEDLQEPETLPAVPTPYYGQTYMPYPPVMVPAQSPQTEKRPWYKRLLNPFSKRASLPILQAPKVPKEPPKETVALPDPLIRLAKGVAYNNAHVPPGFYLLSLQQGAAGSPAMLLLRRQQQTVLSVPAQPVASSTSKTPSPATSDLPPPPDKSDPQAKTDSKNKRVENATALVELAENGHTVVLVYKKGAQQYTSIPLEVDDGWKPQ